MNYLDSDTKLQTYDFWLVDIINNSIYCTTVCWLVYQISQILMKTVVTFMNTGGII